MTASMSADLSFVVPVGLQPFVVMKSTTREARNGSLRIGGSSEGILTASEQSFRFWLFRREAVEHEFAVFGNACELAGVVETIRQLQRHAFRDVVRALLNVRGGEEHS